jgi:putative phage-type endonuclease
MQQIDQRTAAWFEQRLGKVTASKIADVMAKTKSGPSASRKNYMMTLLCQRLTGQVEEGFSSAAMQRGTDLEPIARSAYEVDKGVMVQECGFMPCPMIEMAGASPDGLVGDDGLTEIKCPNTAQHVEFLRTGKIDNGYQLQMMFQMMCTGRKWCDFVSYDDRMPEALQYKCQRLEYSETVAADIHAEVTAFLKELDALESEMRGLMMKAAA